MGSFIVYMRQMDVTIAVVPIIYPVFSQKGLFKIQDLFFQGVLEWHIGIFSCFLQVFFSLELATSSFFNLF